MTMQHLLLPNNQLSLNKAPVIVIINVAIVAARVAATDAVVVPASAVVCGHYIH